jgi:hypothetical protein
MKGDHMPLLDHFRPPLEDDCPWESFHSAWANAMVVRLNQDLLPENYRAVPQVHLGARVEIDVATFREKVAEQSGGNGKTTAIWAPPQAKVAVAVDFADQDTFEVLIREQGRRRLVAAVELVSPGNKDRPGHRRDFAIKCAGYLQHRVAVVVVDAVTERRDSLHKELVSLLGLPAALAEAAPWPLYAVAYRLRQREDQDHLELWPEALAVGAALPTLPLWISEDTAVPLDLELTYRTACEALRIS